MLKSYETNSLAKLQINYFDNSQAGLYCLIALYFTILKSYVQTCDLVSNILFLFACFGNKSKIFLSRDYCTKKVPLAFCLLPYALHALLFFVRLCDCAAAESFVWKMSIFCQHKAPFLLWLTLTSLSNIYFAPIVFVKDKEM